MAISNYVLSLSMALAISTICSPLKVHADTVRPARISQNKQMHAFVYRDSQDLLASGSIAKEKLAVKDSSSSEQPNKNGVKLDWQKFDDSLFARAKKENKFVLLDLEAVWCHWCHVMDKKTYSHPLVAEIIKSKFIPVKVDQDSRPDLSHKYEDYGWPATIIFDANGNEIVKRSGYIRPQRMIRLLNAIIADPSPEDKPPKKFEYNRKGSLSEPLKQELLNRHIKGYDTEHGAWGRFHKFLDWDSVEYAMELGVAGDKQSAKRAVKTLEAQLNLMDPVWGGVYQYSTDGDWKHPHFEKIMQMQAENLRIYSLGYNLYKQDQFLKAAKDIARYLNTFLSSPTGAFYTSQDADLKPGEHSSGYFNLGDKKRRALGIPRIDKHIYARENGWAINGFAHLYMATGDAQYLQRAIKAANWIIKNRSIPGGGFSHDKNDVAGPYLGDNLAMGRAFLSLYAATADRAWLNKASKVGLFIKKNFEPKSAYSAGYLTASIKSSKVAKPEPLPDENAMLARFSNLLFHYTGEQTFKAISKKAMQYIATPQIAKRRKILVAGPLLADRELSRDPVHVTIVGSKSDVKAKLLFKAALTSPSVYKRIEWYDRKEGKLPNMEVDYPPLPKAAAFSCGNGICSPPKYEPEKVKEFFESKRTSG